MTYDVIVIGAGHNGLTAAAYLAKQGKRILVLERRPQIGGSVVTEEFSEGFRVDSVWAGGRLRPAIERELRLNRYGWQPDPAPAPFALFHDDSTPLVFDPDPLQAAQAIRRFSERDAARWPEFVRFLDRAAYLLDVTYETIMPRLPRSFTLAEGYGLLEWALELRLAGRREMLHFIRALPMTALELAEESFESEPVRAAVAALAIHSHTLGPFSAGTGYTLIHNWLNRGGMAHPNVGKAGQLTQALAQTVTTHGGQIRTQAEVTRILIDTYTCRGVALSDGSEISARAVLSTADPKRTFFALVGAVYLPTEFVAAVRSIKMRGAAARVHLLTDGQHGLPAGTIAVAPSVTYLERAYDAAKYNQMSERPFVEATVSGNVISLFVQFVPYTWDAPPQAARSIVLQRALEVLAPYAPRLASSIRQSVVLLPQDLEETYSLTEGDLNHGQLMLDQFLFMRPLPGWSNHKTPIDNLYLGGSGVHGGGGVSGTAGRNAARVLRRL